MSAPRTLTVELLSDTTFGRGEGTAGAVDVEVEHDELGLPFLGGKTLRGLLRDSWLSMEEHFPRLRPAALRVHGPTREVGETGILRIGDARLDARTREWIAWAEGRDRQPLSPVAVLEALTDIRAQTAEERTTAAPAETTLRAVRVVLRGLVLEAPLAWLAETTGDDLRCLALGVLATRHAGLGRNRGRGFVRLALDGDPERTRRLARGEEP